jgi:hypothetical protein
LTVLFMAVGCATPEIQVPSAEVNGLLALPASTTGLTPDQSTALRSLLDTSESKRRILDRHVAEESRQLWRLLKNGEPKLGPEIWTQIGLVNQLRMERLLIPVLLRAETNQVLTAEQQVWWRRNRLKLVFPR